MSCEETCFYTCPIYCSSSQWLVGTYWQCFILMFDFSFHIVGASCTLVKVWTKMISSAVELNCVCHKLIALQDLPFPTFILVTLGGRWHWKCFSWIFVLIIKFCNVHFFSHLLNFCDELTICTLSRYSTISFESLTQIHYSISNFLWCQAPLIHNSMCKCKVRRPCCSTVP